MKPLFIPLISAYYYAFRDGLKSAEYRRYGPRWNESTCAIGRPVTLSRGYGKTDRMGGTVSGFLRVPAKSLSVEMQYAISDLYGTLDIDVAVIGIRLGAP